MPTFDLNDHGHNMEWYNKLIPLLEELQADEEVKDKPGLLRGILLSMYYPDANCPDCHGEVGKAKPRKGPHSTNYPYRVEEDGDDHLLATYECRNCGYIYQVGYAGIYHELQFG
jgi:hypothetical protein